MDDTSSFAETVRRQRMVRAPYADTPVPRELVAQLVADAQKAPSAGFSQGVTFLALDGDDVAGFWRLTLPDGVDPDLMQPCPVVLLPIEDKQAYLDRYSEADKARWGLGEGADRWPVPYWTVDAAFASMTLLLSATARGLGGWFFGIFQGEQELLRRHGVPDGRRPIGAIALGYPREGARAGGSARHRPRRALDDVLRWSRW